MTTRKVIELIGARQHNLKNLSLKIPKETLVVVTGPSGSGKSSLAFDTLFAEGQRRYMESLSAYVRQFLDKQEKPDIDEIRGLSPTIAIEQKNHTKNSRSTVGTATEIYDYLRILFAKLGRMYDPDSGLEVKRHLVGDVVRGLLESHPMGRVYVVFPIDFSAKSKIADRRLLLKSLRERGYTKVCLSTLVGKDVVFFDLEEEFDNAKTKLLGKASTHQQILVMADRGILETESRGRLEDALSLAYQEGFGRAEALVLDDDGVLKASFFCTDYPSAGRSERRFPELSPLLFSFNSPVGACPGCKGFGNILRVDQDLVIPNPALTLAQGAVEPFTKPSSRDWLKSLLRYCQNKKISLNVPWERLPEKDRKLIWSGDGEWVGIEGLFEELEEDRYKMQVRVFLSRYRSPKTCPDCGGHRLKPESRWVKFRERSIGDLCALPINKLHSFLKGLKLSPNEAEITKDLMPQILGRLDFLLRVGLEYLTLDRLAKTLSGGEAQRIALANQLGSRLTQTTYVLDEPSIGLHPRDTERLIGILNDLVALRNSVVVVEHDPDIIRAAGHLVDLGPEAGMNGGQLLYSGPFKDFPKAKLPLPSYTQKYLTGEEHVPVPMRRRSDRQKDRRQTVKTISVSGCRANNLKNVNLRIPVGMLTCVTGVSGSGKSSAVRQTLFPALAKIFLQRVEEVGAFERISGFDAIQNVQLVDQSPIGRSPRSNPITFMKAFDEVRSLFASTEEARRKRFHPGYFSFNVPGGRCETCEGDGAQRVEMVFMEDLFLPCDVCHGKKFKPEVLAIQFNGKNIDDVLNMTVSEAKKFFVGASRLLQNLHVLEQVGLGYLRLGQPSTTLSGGESQRLKIARELGSGDGNPTLYILDEPTTGLHFRDVKILLRVLHQLVERGHTVLVIEHNLDVMKSADWIIDFGPEGGEAGGKILVEGTPEDVVAQGKGHTARYLKAVLENSPHVSVPELLEEVVR